MLLLAPQTKGGIIGHSFGSLFLKVGLVRPDGLNSLASLSAISTDLFFDAGKPYEPSWAWRLF